MLYMARIWLLTTHRTGTCKDLWADVCAHGRRGMFLYGKEVGSKRYAVRGAFAGRGFGLRRFVMGGMARVSVRF